MLNDRDRNALCELERQLAAEDPEFVRSFADRQRRLPAGGRDRTLQIIIIVGALLTGLILVAGSSIGALASAAATGMWWWAWRDLIETSRHRT